MCIYFRLFLSISIALLLCPIKSQDIRASTHVHDVNRLCFASQDDCRKCILAHPDCTWCFDNRTTPGTRQTRCRTFSENTRHCRSGFIENPQNRQDPTRDDDFSIVTDDTDIASEEIIQLRPQALNVKLRKAFRFNIDFTLQDIASTTCLEGQPQKLNITFRRVIDYPLDLYYVMDLSFSMRDDLEELQKLGASLVDSIKNFTNNVRLGFGTFVDKVMLPYASTIEKQLQDPCLNVEEASCAPGFGFRHQLSVTSNGSAFRDAVGATRISGNIDPPEGGFDALMQIAVCQDKIEWRQEALRVILFTSDASPHIAMDGKLAAILEINDMKCHLERGFNPYLPKDAMVYSKSKLLDYPSIGQLKKAFDDNKIQTIFAVTKDVLPLYQDLPKLLANSFVDVLKSDSSNVISVISTSYNALRSKITLSRPSVPDNVEMEYRVLCPGTTTWVEKSLECNNASIGDEVVFQFELMLSSCPEDQRSSDVVSISSSSIRDVVQLTIEYLCDCGCLKQSVINSPACSERGNLECGVCSCNGNALGLQCQCKESKSGIPLEQSCTPGNLVAGATVCSNQGYCECGKCQCEDGYHGDYCQCRRLGCPEDSEGLLCGGIERGTCENCNGNPICDCNEKGGGWTFDNNTKLCICNEKACKADNVTDICSGHGFCDCDTCECDSKYGGRFCQKCIHPDCYSVEGTCSGQDIQSCAACVYEQERLRKDVNEMCSKLCNEKGINVLPVESLPDCSVCSNSQQSDLCDLCKTFSTDPSVHVPIECEVKPFENCYAKYMIVWDIVRSGYLVFVRNFEHDRDCPEIDALSIIIPVVGGILLIGIIALIIWKIIATVRDKHEYRRFVLETSKAKWAGGESKLYVDPSERINNPLYLGND